MSPSLSLNGQKVYADLLFSEFGNSVTIKLPTGEETEERLYPDHGTVYPILVKKLFLETIGDNLNLAP